MPRLIDVTVSEGPRGRKAAVIAAIVGNGDLHRLTVEEARLLRDGLAAAIERAERGDIPRGGPRAPQPPPANAAALPAAA